MDDQLKNIKTENTEKQPIKRHRWKSSEDKILLNILKEQTLNGGKDGTRYTKKAWREIQEKFNDSRVVDKLELQQLKNRHKYYRSCYATIDRLLKLTGFGWDDEDKMIKASNENWEDLISKDKSIQEYRDKVWPNWIDLQDICASSSASGDGAISSKGKGGTSKVQIDLNEVVDLESSETNDLQVACPEKPDTTKPEKKKCNASGSQDTPKGQKRTADDAITAFDRLANASLSIVESKKNAAQQIDAYLVKSCMQILNNMPNLEGKKKLKAAQAFTDCNLRAIFIEMDEETRSLWIEDA